MSVARSRPYLHQNPPRLTGGGSYPLRDDSGEPLIRLQSLGAATVLVGESRLSAAAGTLFSLLIRVACTPGMLIGRDVLLRSLWPTQDEVRQRANLRQALYKLRSNGVRIALHGDVVQLDVSQVLRTFSLDRTAITFERDVTLGHEPFGPFLAGFVVPWPEYQEWIDTERENVHADVRRVLVHELRRRRERADWGGADALARWLLQFDPLNEEATLTIAECTALSGSKSEAIAILDRFLAELGPMAGDIRLPATMLRRRIAEPPSRGRLSFAPTERHFLGREDELASLTLSMRRARWHDGSGVLLHGAPGIGKSRLVHELQKVAVIEGVRVAETSCRESDLHRPLSVFLDLVPELLMQAGALGCDPGSLAALRRLVPSDRRSVSSPPAGDVTGEVAGPYTAPAAQAGAAEIVDRDVSPAPLMPREPMPMMSSLRRAIIDLLSAVSDERPLLLVVDDVHWIDEHSWDVLADLIERVASMRVFVLLTSREAHARPQSPQRIPLALAVRELPALSAESCLLLTRAIGDDLSAPVDDALGDWFVRASEGNPLFLRALVNHWIETGEAGGVPPTLRGVIEQRLGQLSGDALRVLQTAALLGKWATTERVFQVLQLSSHAALQFVNELETGGMFRTTVPPQIACHEMMAESAIRKLLPMTKRLLHSSIARALGRELEEHPQYGILLPALGHLRDSADWGAIVKLAIIHGDRIESYWQPMEILRLLETVPKMQAVESDWSRFNGICSRLRVHCGLYREELDRTINDFRLPIIDGKMELSVLEQALSRIDSAYRSDTMVELVQMTDFVGQVVQERQFPQQLRLRAAGIGLIILSNQCDGPAADELWRSLELHDSQGRASVECRRVAILYHTIFGDLAESAALSALLLQDAMRDRMTLTAPADAIRAGFALRISSSIPECLRAFTFAFETAQELSLSAISINAAWQLAQCYLEFGDDAHYQTWTETLLRLHIESSDRVSTNFAAALFCRDAIEKRDQVRAKQLYEEFTRDLPVHRTIRAESHALALSSAISLLDEAWTPTDLHVDALLSYANQVTKFGTADFYASIVCEVLMRQDFRSARGFFTRYILDYRRETTPLSSRLARTATLIDIPSSSELKFICQ